GGTVQRRIVPSRPALSPGETIEAKTRVGDEHRELPPKSIEPGRFLVEHDHGQPLQGFTDLYTAERGREQVVGGRRLGLAEELPHETSGQRHRGGAPERD